MHAIDRDRQVCQISSQDQKRGALATFLELGHYLSVGIESANNNKTEASRALKEAEVAKAEASDAKAKVECLKEMLKEAERISAEIKSAQEFDLVSKVKRRKKVETEVTEVKREGEKMMTEAKRLAMEEFKAFKELTTIKVQFAREAYNAGYDTCQQRVAEQHPELDLNFLEDELGDSFDFDLLEYSQSTFCQSFY
ncbi:hypothetical protein COCNU_scaffold002256G000010 [Cocos nucifera]|nr:hypothetical protein [Cocos nucifera]